MINASDKMSAPHSVFLAGLCDVQCTLVNILHLMHIRILCINNEDSYVFLNVTTDCCSGFQISMVMMAGHTSIILVRCSMLEDRAVMLSM